MLTHPMFCMQAMPAYPPGPERRDILDPAEVTKR